MIPREPFWAADVSGDPVAALRASVERLLIPVEQHLDAWDIELPQALAGPRVTPALRQQLAELRAATQRCRELGEAMVDAAAHLAVADPQPASDEEPPGGDAA